MDKSKLIVPVLFAALLINSGIAMYLALDRESCESCEMRFNKTDMSGLNGVHKYDQYICVWTEGRAADEVGGTLSHELAHMHVREDYFHFCEEYFPEKRSCDT